MGTWPTAPLGEVAPLVRRPVDVDPNATYREIGLRSYGKGVFHKTPVSGLELGGKRVFEVAPGDLLFSNVFAWEGAVAVASQSEQGMIGSHRFITCVVQPDKAVPDFLKYFFMVPAGLSQLQAASPGGAGRNRTLGLNRLARIRVPLPALSEQRRIVARLNAVFDLLEARHNTLQDQQRELKALLHAAFVRITADAPRARMGDIAPLVRRPVDVQHDRMYPELGIRSFGRGTFHKPAVAGGDVGSKRLFAIEPGDLLFSNVFAWEGAVAIASPDDGGRVGSHRFMTCVADQARISAEMLRFFFLTPEGLKLLGDASPGGAGRNRTLGLGALKRIEVPVPAKGAQIWFDQLHTKITALRAQHTAITTDCDALLPAMLNEIFE